MLKGDRHAAAGGAQGAAARRSTGAPSSSTPGLHRGEKLRRETTLPERATIQARDGTALAKGPDRLSDLGPLASEIVGNIGPAPPERAKELAARGVPTGAPVGLTGLEREFDERLSGTPGGVLYAGGRVLAEKKPRQGRRGADHDRPEAPARRGRGAGRPLRRDRGRAAGDRRGAGAGRDRRVGPAAAREHVQDRDPRRRARQQGRQARLEVYPYENFATLEGVEIDNANGESCGGTLRISFAHSCNSVFAPLGAKLGAEKLVETAQKFGFNQDPGLTGAARSTIPAGDGDRRRPRGRLDGDRSGQGARHPAADGARRGDDRRQRHAPVTDAAQGRRHGQDPRRHDGHREDDQELHAHRGHRRHGRRGRAAERQGRRARRAPRSCGRRSRTSRRRRSPTPTSRRTTTRPTPTPGSPRSRRSPSRRSPWRCCSSVRARAGTPPRPRRGPSSPRPSKVGEGPPRLRSEVQIDVRRDRARLVDRQHQWPVLRSTRPSGGRGSASPGSGRWTPPSRAAAGRWRGRAAPGCSRNTFVVRELDRLVLVALGVGDREVGRRLDRPVGVVLDPHPDAEPRVALADGRRARRAGPPGTGHPRRHPGSGSARAAPGRRDRRRRRRCLRFRQNGRIRPCHRTRREPRRRRQRLRGPGNASTAEVTTHRWSRAPRGPSPLRGSPASGATPCPAAACTSHGAA